MLHVLPENNLCFPEKSREQTLFSLSVLRRTESFPSEPYLWWISPPQVFPFPSLCFYNINPPHQYQNINNNPLCIWFNKGFPLGYSMESPHQFFSFSPQIFLRIKAKITYSAGKWNEASHIPQLDFFKPREACINQGDVSVPPKKWSLDPFQINSVNWGMCDGNITAGTSIAILSPTSLVFSQTPKWSNFHHF